MTIREILAIISEKVPTFFLSALEWAYDAFGHFIFLEILDLTVAQLLFILAIIGFVVIALRENLKAIEEDYYYILEERAELTVVYGWNEEEINEHVKQRSGGEEYLGNKRKYERISNAGLMYVFKLLVKFILIVWILMMSFDYDENPNLWLWNPILLGILLLYGELKRSALKRAEKNAEAKKIYYLNRQKKDN